MSTQEKLLPWLLKKAKKNSLFLYPANINLIFVHWSYSVFAQCKTEEITWYVVREFKFVSTFICYSQSNLHLLAGILSFSPMFDMPLTGRGESNVKFIRLLTYSIIYFVQH